MAYPKDCPYCKKGNLSLFDHTPMTAILNCSNCDRLVTVKTTTGKVLEVAVPGLTALVSLASLAAFFGISDITKLKEWISPSGR
jgi:hypothetical protein